MEIAKLEAIISGDVKPLVAALNTAKTEIQKFENVGADAFIGLNAGLSNTAKAALLAGTDIRSLTAALDVLQAEQAGIVRGTTLWKLYETEIKNVNRQLDILETELPVVAAEMKAVGASATSSFGNVGKGLTSAFSGLKQIAYILPGLGIAGIFNLAFEAISAAASELGIFGAKVEEASEESKKFADSLSSIEEAIAKDILKSRELLTIVASRDSPYEVRRQALKNLRDEYGTYLKNLSDEELLSGNIAAAIRQINDALLAKLTLQAGEEKIIALLKQRLDAQIKLNQLQEKQLNTAVFANQLKDATGNAKALGVQLKASLQDTFPEQAKLQNNIQSIDKSIEALFNTLKASIIDSSGLIVGGLKPAKDEIEAILQDLNTNIKHIKDQFIGAIATETGDALAPVARTLERLASIKVEPVSTGVFERLNIKNLEKFNAQLKTMKDVASEIAGVFADMFTEFITKGRISFDQLAKSVERLISKLIEAVLQTFLLQAITAALTGGTSAAGFGLANFLKSGIHFADGGIITSPTTFGSASFAENGPEAVIPLDRLQNMVSGLGQNNLHITGELRAHGTDLVVALNRGNVRINRNYGSNFSN